MKKGYLAGILLLIFIVLALTYERLNKLDALGHTVFYGNTFFEAFYVLGNTKTVTIIGFIVLIWQLIIRNRRGAILVLLSVAGATVINQLLKNVFERPRPEMINQLESFSFPSGHSMMSVGYLILLAYLVIQHISRSYLKQFIFGLALLLVVCIGASRIAQGHHYLTDILAGWSLAGAWVIVCILWYEKKLGRK